MSGERPLSSEQLRAMGITPEQLSSQDSGLEDQPLTQPKGTFTHKTEGNLEGREQSREEVLAILERALREGIPADLTIVDSGVGNPVRDIYIDEIDQKEGIVWTTYLVAEGQFGEGIPLEIDRIHGAELPASKKG